MGQKEGLYWLQALDPSVENEVWKEPRLWLWKVLSSNSLHITVFNVFPGFGAWKRREFCVWIPDFLQVEICSAKHSLLGNWFWPLRWIKENRLFFVLYFHGMIITKSIPFILAGKKWGVTLCKALKKVLVLKQNKTRWWVSSGDNYAMKYSSLVIPGFV